MKPTQIYDFTLAANGSRRLQVAGEYFRILTATATVRVDSTFGSLTPLSSGMGLDKTAFDYLYFTDLSGASNTLRIVVGDSKFVDAALASVTVTSSTVPKTAAMVQSTANVTNASASLVAANLARQYLLIQNKDAAGTLYLNLAGAAATVAGGVRVPPGGAFEFAGVVPTGAIFAIGDIAANANVIVVEG